MLICRNSPPCSTHLHNTPQHICKVCEINSENAFKTGSHMFPSVGRANECSVRLCQVRESRLDQVRSDSPWQTPQPRDGRLQPLAWKTPHAPTAKPCASLSGCCPQARANNAEPKRRLPRARVNAHALPFVTLRYITSGWITWRGVAWHDVTWRDVTWRGVAWRDVTWRDLTYFPWPGLTLHCITLPYLPRGTRASRF